VAAENCQAARVAQSSININGCVPSELFGKSELRERREREAATRHTISTIARAFPESICVPARLVKLAGHVSTAKADKIARQIFDAPFASHK
jgi:hypothetical protein